MVTRINALANEAIMKSAQRGVKLAMDKRTGNDSDFIPIHLRVLKPKGTKSGTMNIAYATSEHSSIKDFYDEYGLHVDDMDDNTLVVFKLTIHATGTASDFKGVLAYANGRNAYIKQDLYIGVSAQQIVALNGLLVNDDNAITTILGDVPLAYLQKRVEKLLKGNTSNQWKTRKEENANGSTYKAIVNTVNDAILAE